MIETYVAGGVLVGLIVGRWWRSRKDLTDRMRLVEMYERRTRLAQNEHEEAIRTLNHGQIEVRRIQGLFGGLESRIAELEGEVIVAQNDASATSKDLGVRDQELVAAGASLTSLRNANEKLAKDTRAAEATRKHAVDRMSELEERTLAAEANANTFEEKAIRVSERMDELTARALEADQLDQDLAGVRDELADRDSSIVEFTARVEGHVEKETALGTQLGEANRALSQREETWSGRADMLSSRAGQAEQSLDEIRARVAQLAPLEAKLQQAEARLERQGEELENAVGRAATLGERVRELEPLGGQLHEAKDALTQRQETWNERNTMLAGRAAEVEQQLSESRVRVVELEPLIAQLSAADAALETQREELDEAGVRADALAGRVRELEPLIAKFDEAQRALEQREETWSEREDMLAGRAGDAEHSVTALRARVIELEPLQAQLAAADSKVETQRAELDEVHAQAEASAERVRELEPLVGKFDESQRALEQREEIWNEKAGMLSGRAGDAEHSLESARARVLELEPLVAKLDSAQVSLEARERELEEAQESCMTLGARVRDLEPLGAQRDEARFALEERETSWRERNVGLSERADETQQSLDSTRSRVAELEPLIDEVARLKGELIEREAHWKSSQDLVTARAAESESSLTESKSASGELSKRLHALEAQNAQSAEELTTLKSRLAGREEEVERLKDAKAEAKRYSSELVRAKKSETGLDGLLGKERTRSEQAREKLDAARNASAEQRVQLDGLREQMANVSASHKVVQLKCDRYAKRVDELERDVRSRKDKASEAVRDKRERETLLRGLETRLKKSEATAAKSAAQLEVARAKPAAGKSVRPRKAPAKKKAAPKRRDDLTELAGVGPAMAKKLGSAGFHAYGDIARLDKDGLNALAEKVGLTPQALRKNRWVSTSSRLHKAKYGTPVGS